MLLACHHRKRNLGMQNKIPLRINAKYGRRRESHHRQISKEM